MLSPPLINSLFNSLPVYLDYINIVSLTLSVINSFHVLKVVLIPALKSYLTVIDSIRNF